MNVLRHWTATKTDADKTLLRDFIAAEWVESYRAAGWTVEGPFVPEPPEGAVDQITTRIENLPTFQRCDSASDLPAVDRDAVLSIVRFHLGEQ